jgi:site-specific DNA-methyltransferase (adenine-specific)
MDEVFPGVDFEGGVCYFLWDRDTAGPCSMTSVRDGQITGPFPRDLDEFDVLVRDYRALGILRKVRAAGGDSITSILSVDKEFGWTSNFTGFHATHRPGDVPVYYVRQGKRAVGYIARADVTKSAHLIDTWKVMVPAAYGERGAKPAKILGPTLVAPSPSTCTQSFLFFWAATELEARSIQSYTSTRLFRFLVSLRKITQHATRSTYSWVPALSWDKVWTDEDLYERFNITDEDREFIESNIRPAEAGGE